MLNTWSTHLLWPQEFFATLFEKDLKVKNKKRKEGGKNPDIKMRPENLGEGQGSGFYHLLLNHQHQLWVSALSQGYVCPPHRLWKAGVLVFSLAMGDAKLEKLTW